MTEAEWLTCEDPVRRLAHLHRPPGDRKLLLYAVACCSAHVSRLKHFASREAVRWAERFADGDALRDDSSARIEWASEGAAFECERTRIGAEFGDEYALSGDSMEASEVSGRDLRRLRGRIPAEALAVRAAYFANALTTLDTRDPFDPSLREYSVLLSVPLLRDIFGNPFRPVTFDPAWRTDAAVALARQMYESRDFGAMPILADALQEAGCDSADVLGHCRGAGPHVRGCWVVDLVLGKE